MREINIKPYMEPALFERLNINIFDILTLILAISTALGTAQGISCDWQGNIAMVVSTFECAVIGAGLHREIVLSVTMLHAHSQRRITTAFKACSGVQQRNIIIGGRIIYG